MMNGQNSNSQKGESPEPPVEKEWVPKTDIGREWAELFKETDACSEIHRLTDEEIAAEIEAYRAERRNRAKK